MAGGGKRTRVLSQTFRLGARRSLGPRDRNLVQHDRQLLGRQGSLHLDAIAGLGTLVGCGDEDLPRACVARLLVHHRERLSRFLGRQRRLSLEAEPQRRVGVHLYRERDRALTFSAVLI